MQLNLLKMEAGNKSSRDALKLSEEQTLNFITLYENEPILWNPFLENYRNREARAYAAERISKRLNVRGFGPEQVITKFKNLRSSYCQELKKIAASESLGTSRDKIYRPGVKWFSKMDSFLKPHVSARYDVHFSRGSLYQMNALTDKVASENDASSNNKPYEFESLCTSSRKDDLDVYEPDLSIVKEEHCLDTFSNSNYKKFKPSEPDHCSSPLPGPSTTEDSHLVESQHDTDETLNQFTKYLVTLIKALPRHKAFMLQQKIIKLALDANIENEST